MGLSDEQSDGQSDEQEESTSDAATLGSLSFDRVRTALDAMGSRYFVDSDGDLGGRWGGNDFYFFLGGDQHEVLTVHGYWWAHLPADRYDDAVRAANDWNRDHYWPSAHVRMDDYGSVRVHTGVTIDWENGVTNAQLVRQLRTGTNTGCQFFDHMDELFPDAKH
jgi:hypothetical protein